MYVYQMSFPIDVFGVMREFAHIYNDALEEEKTDRHTLPLSSNDLRYLLKRSLRTLARMKTYWEGDVRTGDLYIGSVPGDDNYNDSHYFIALKQDNNGSSYIVSQVEFRHLHESLITEDLGCPVSQRIQDGIKEILDSYTPSSKEAELEVFE